MTRWLCAVVIAAALSAPAITQPSNTPVAFVHVTIIDAATSTARPDQTVVVSRDRMTQVGPARDVHLPDGARTIDATGRFMIPGLWDAHVHTRYEGIDHLRLLVAHGITSARNMSGPWEHLAQVREWKDQISKGARVGPRIVTAGPILDGPGPGRSTVVINHPDEGRLAVRRIKREGADFVKVYNLLSRETFDAIANEAKAQQLPIAGHVPIALSPIDVSDAGLRFIEHLDAIAWASSDRRGSQGAVTGLAFGTSHIANHRSTSRRVIQRRKVGARGRTSQGESHERSRDAVAVLEQI